MFFEDFLRNSTFFSFFKVNPFDYDIKMFFCRFEVVLKIVEFVST